MKQLLKYYYSKLSSKPVYQGPYTSWFEAQKNSISYSDIEILKASHSATTQVKQGLAYIEQDGIAIKTPQYRHPLIASLLYILNRSASSLSVLDIGGALGSLYFQCKHWLGTSQTIRWYVLEQPHIVEFAQQHYQDKNLTFINTINEIELRSRPQVALLSSSLQYFEEPYNLVSRLIGDNFSYIIYDRTPFSSRQNTKIMLQNVNTKNYITNYPSWILNENHLKDILNEKYKLFSSFTCEESNILLSPRESVYFKGALWQKRLA
jgi:putative methyltransferase (TIGR04325 family)